MRKAATLVDGVLLATVFGLLPQPARAAAGIPFMGIEFGKLLCNAWNQTRLPTTLGRGDVGWIDSMGSKGAQPIIMRRGDCASLPFLKLEMVADATGNAVCKQASVFKVGDKYTWKMEPDTAKWASYADGFGLTDLPGIFTKFEGDTAMAASNTGEFEVFFATAGYLALQHKVDWRCDGVDAKLVDSEVKAIDSGKVADILKGMPVLQSH